MGAHSHINAKIERATEAARRLGLFRAEEFVTAGFPHEYIRRLLKRGTIHQVSRGLYASDSFEGDQNRSLVEATKRFPKGVVCLISALRFHEIGTQSPFQVWLALPSDASQPRTAEELPIRFCKFSTATHNFGVESHHLPGGRIHVFTPAKTVADCFKYRNKFGVDVAVEAMKDGWKQRKFTLADLADAAAICRVRKVVQPYLEMLA
ncbi:type IV toxin-antitoxin system AbiEi family antitoxin domain-containing protein [Pelagicoccus sp. NFK12]|uniref:Type IV toxin-antitoxin system AbiEi family antitoxin domain-containing protein n=1 Tax=Pelagicoccus enzymogenes TaxID=2773457 RepID=A0A927IJC3_9BACT|nr:type IV toxin-antitoxin system AbiEi family antitoxin domain-containing protein [Pelagicoccus enzymogenes]MBD5781648.1 type IV toxin-antitoxin system AbiEi family antitoxin domain-containing protein [Pelagicoccus enzymogenes]